VVFLDRSTPRFAAARGCARRHRPGSRASAAGVTWTCRTAKAEWAARSGHTSVIDAAGAIYVIGGTGNDIFNDVWASTDGGARPDSVYGGGVGAIFTGVLAEHSMVTIGVLRGTLGVLR
jgi:hypothetical protein